MEEGSVLETPLKMKYATDWSVLLMAAFPTHASLESSVTQLLMDPGNVDPAQMVIGAMELPVKMSTSVIWCQIYVIKWVAYSSV